MKILVFGKNGQLGWELQRSLAPLGEVVALGGHDTPWGDFSQPADLAAGVVALAPNIIVNAAAYTKVDQAETDPASMAVNAVAPGLLAQAAAELGAWLVHYSTDYVFDGSGTHAWNENHTAKPLNAYGRSKLAGEESIRAAGCKHLVFRTSWLYAARGNNFAQTILKLAQERDTLVVVNDQFGAPTGADLVADITAHALRAVAQQPELGGTYHLAAAGVTTWYDYAQHVINHARAAGLALTLADSGLHAIPSSQYPTPAQRPANSRLDTGKLRQAFGLHLPDWQTGVDRMLVETLATHPTKHSLP